MKIVHIVLKMNHYHLDVYYIPSSGAKLRRKIILSVPRLPVSMLTI